MITECVRKKQGRVSVPPPQAESKLLSFYVFNRKVQPHFLELRGGGDAFFRPASQGAGFIQFNSRVFINAPGRGDQFPEELYPPPTPREGAGDAALLPGGIVLVIDNHVRVSL